MYNASLRRKWDLYSVTETAKEMVWNKVYKKVEKKVYNKVLNWANTKKLLNWLSN